MEYKLEIQSKGFQINENEIIELVEHSLEQKKVNKSKINNLQIYYVSDTKIIHYICEFNKQKISGQIYII